MYSIGGWTAVDEASGRRKPIWPPSRSELRDVRRGLYKIAMVILCMYRETLLRR